MKSVKAKECLPIIWRAPSFWLGEVSVAWRISSNSDIVFWSISFLFLQAEWRRVWAAVTGETKSLKYKVLNKYRNIVTISNLKDIKLDPNVFVRVCLPQLCDALRVAHEREYDVLYDLDHVVLDELPALCIAASRDSMRLPFWSWLGVFLWKHILFLISVIITSILYYVWYF